MAKFCTKCGKELVDGNPCECEKVVETKNENKDISSLLTEFIEVTKKMFSKPIDTLKENSKESKFNLAIVAAVSLLITMGLFVFVLIKEWFLKLAFGLTGLSGFSSLSSSIDVPFFKVFISAGITSILYIALLAVVTYVIATKVLKGKTSIKKLFIMYSFSSIVLSIFLLLGTIAIFINPTLAIIIVCAGSMLNMYYNYKGLEHSIKIDVNMLGYIFVPSILITSYVLQFIIPKIFN